jgi:hypothetical protein
MYMNREKLAINSLSYCNLAIWVNGYMLQLFCSARSIVRAKFAIAPADAVASPSGATGAPWRVTQALAHQSGYSSKCDCESFLETGFYLRVDLLAGL